MLISIVAFGSRGDVQPCVALACELIERGHQVRLIGPAELVEAAAGTAIDYRSVDLNQKAQIEAFINSGGGFIRTFRMQRRNLRDHSVRAMRAAEREAAGSDLLVSATLTLSLAADLGERWRIPVVHSLLFPSFPTAAFPTPLILPLASAWPGWLNRLSHYFTWTAIWALIAGPVNVARRSVLGLGPRRFRGFMTLLKDPASPLLMAYSPAMVPEARDWPPHVVTTGFWHRPLPPGWQPPDALVAFIAAGPPPIYIGFGSMTFANPQAVADVVMRAVAETGRRVIMSSGWAGLRPSLVPEDAFLVDDVPHEWLFPQMALVVHHGGSGTVAAALRAGVPSVVIPFAADQAFWAWRLNRLGVAPRPIPVAKLTRSKLARAIAVALSSPAIRQRAAELGATIGAERGVANAVAAIEACAVAPARAAAGETL